MDGSETELALVQVMNPEDARKYMDENTIGLVVMFGSTYNGQFEDVVLADKIVGGSADFCPACSGIGSPCLRFPHKCKQKSAHAMLNHFTSLPVGPMHAAKAVPFLQAR